MDKFKEISQVPLHDNKQLHSRSGCFFCWWTAIYLSVNALDSGAFVGPISVLHIVKLPDKLRHHLHPGIYPHRSRLVHHISIFAHLCACYLFLLGTKIYDWDEGHFFKPEFFSCNAHRPVFATCLFSSINGCGLNRFMSVQKLTHRFHNVTESPALDSGH